MADVKTYAAVAMQLAARSVERAADKAAARKQMMETIASMEPKIRSAGVFVQQYAGTPVKLAVLPEYVLTSYPGRISIPDFADIAALEVDGPEYEAMGAMAQRLAIVSAELPSQSWAYNDVAYGWLVHEGKGGHEGIGPRPWVEIEAARSQTHLDAARRDVMARR